MKKILCSLVFISLAACGNQEVSQPATVTVTSTVTQQVSPTKKQSLTSEQCVHNNLGPDWPVDSAIGIWNNNGKNFLRTYTLGLSSCDNHVLLQLVRELPDGFSGETTYHMSSATVVLFADSVPRNLRQSLLCHELGHVLGLPHSTEPGSCMQTDVAMMPSVPSKNDLQTVSKEVWNWTSAFKSSGVR